MSNGRGWVIQHRWVTQDKWVTLWDTAADKRCDAIFLYGDVNREDYSSGRRRGVLRCVRCVAVVPEGREPCE